MLILGIDTSGRQGSVALLQAQGEQLTPLGLSALSGRQYSELLLSTIDGLLARHGLQKSSIGLIGVASGPGSFTGLRISIATVKGLAEAFVVPVVAVSVLEAIADASGAEGRVIAAIDAQRSEVFWGEYTLESTAESTPQLATQSANQSEAPEPATEKLAAKPAPSIVSEALASFADFTSRLASDTAAPKLFTPDVALAARLRQSGVDVFVLANPSAEDFARIAFRKFLAGVRNDVATLDANYLRRSDAEIFSTPAPQ